MRDFALVLLIGLEPIRYFYRGILSPLRLPVSPQQHSIIYYIIIRPRCQQKNNSLKNILFRDDNRLQTNTGKMLAITTKNRVLST